MYHLSPPTSYIINRLLSIIHCLAFTIVCDHCLFVLCHLLFIIHHFWYIINHHHINYHQHQHQHQQHHSYFITHYSTSTSFSQHQHQQLRSVFLFDVAKSRSAKGVRSLSDELTEISLKSFCCQLFLRIFVATYFLPRIIVYKNAKWPYTSTYSWQWWKIIPVSCILWVIVVMNLWPKGN